MSASDTEIVELLPLAREGDDNALGRLLDLHRDYLRALAAQQLHPKLRGRIDDSDVIQQTCLSVHKQFAGFSGNDPAEFVAWLRLIHERNIQNAVRDHVAVQKRSVDRDIALQDDILSAHATTPSQIASKDEEANRLKMALSKLPNGEQEVIRLRYYEGWTVKQIADHLNITPDAVAWKLSKGMKAMKQQMGNDDT